MHYRNVCMNNTCFTKGVMTFSEIAIVIFILLHFTTGKETGDKIFSCTYFPALFLKKWKVLHFFWKSARKWVHEKILSPISFQTINWPMRRYFLLKYDQLAPKSVFECSIFDLFPIITFYDRKRYMRQNFLMYPFPCALSEKMKYVTFFRKSAGKWVHEKFLSPVSFQTIY